MQDAPSLSLSPVPPSKSDHKCPDCLYMELEAVQHTMGADSTLISPSLSSSLQRNPPLEHVDLYLSIQFGEQEETLPGGRIKVGLRGGTLRLTLENCAIPLSNRIVFDSLETTILVERNIKGGEEHQSGAELSLNENKPAVKATIGQKTTTEKSDKFQFDLAQISTKGSPENPAWIFEEKMGEPALKGMLQQTKLGTLNVTATPYRITATFQALLKDIKLTHLEGPWMTDILPEQRAVLDRALALLLLKHKLHPYLSKIELSYD